MRRKSLGIWVGVILLSSPLSCDFPTGPDDGALRPEETADGWETASLESVGMRSGPLKDLLDLIAGTPDHVIHGILIVRNGKLVFEEYWPGADLVPATLAPVEKDFGRETLHYVASVSKSLTSALAGISLGQGALGSVGDSLFSHFPDHLDLRNEDNGPVTLRHLLSFSSGLEWNEFVYGFDDPRDSHYQMFQAQDPIRHLLSRPMVTDPGARFHYNSGDTNLMGEVVRRATGSGTLLEFADEHLFRPLGIDEVEWTRFGYAPHVAFASGGASLRPRDMAKFGAMYLDGGWWNGRQVVPSGWVHESTEMAIPLEGARRTLYGYGYNWWLGRFQFKDGEVEYFRAAGWGGQDIFCFPELDLVLVFTAGGYYDPRPLDVNDIIEDFIFRAIIE